MMNTEKHRILERLIPEVFMLMFSTSKFKVLLMKNG
jgi:hypothetical protein